VIDKNTENLSFLNMSYYLQDCGVDSDKATFMLETKNRALLNFDYTKKDTNDPITGRSYTEDIFNECRNNIWFFFREIVRLPIAGQPHQYETSLRFPLNPLTMKMIWAYEHEIPCFISSDIDDCLRATTMKLLCIYDCIKNTFNTEKLNVITKYGFDEDKFKADLQVISNINDSLLPRLYNFEHFTRVSEFKTPEFLLSWSDTEVRDHTKFCQNDNIEPDPNQAIFVFNADKADHKDMSDIIKMTKHYRNNVGFFIMEGDANNINDRIIEAFLFHWIPKFDNQFFNLSDKEVTQLKNELILIYESEFGYDSNWVDYKYIKRK
jgi:hypothetical protein